jgi:hypothetical protein
MAIDARHSSIVYTFTIFASIGGLFSPFPGADVAFLTALWAVGIFMILSSSSSNIRAPKLRFFLVLLTAGVILSAGIELVSFITLPIYLVVNPILNGLATYRILRTTSKLFASSDSEELFSSFGASVLSVLGEVFGMSEN